MVSEYPRVEVIGAPGFEDFEADLIMDVPSVGGQLMSVVGTEDKNVHVIPAHYVHVIEPEEMDCS